MPLPMNAMLIRSFAPSTRPAGFAAGLLAAAAVDARETVTAANPASRVMKSRRVGRSSLRFMGILLWLCLHGANISLRYSRVLLEQLDRSTWEHAATRQDRCIESANSPPRRCGISL